jgi:segregation and condensation protein A
VSEPIDEPAPAVTAEPAPAVTADPAVGFQVRLDLFEGPFDLLLGLIAKHKLDVTEVALSKVTDDFIGHIRAMGENWDLEQTTQFLVVAATLLDLKAARLLPSGDVEDEEDLALLEARDLLFARLLQYRAFKQVAAIFAERLAVESRRAPRTVGLEPQFANLLPELVLTVTPEQLAALAARAMAPKPPPTVSIEHIHAPAVSVREQAAVIVDRLRRTRSATFRSLVADADGTLVVVARFLALLELFREAAVAFEQLTPLGELTVRWTGSDQGEVGVTDEFDEGASPGDEDPSAGQQAQEEMA